MENNVKLIEFFERFITHERKDRIDEILNKRTKYITVVLEDIFQSHNISAVLRSCDCFGINDVHIIENKHKFIYNKEIGVGSYNWLNIIKHDKHKNNTINTIQYLKSSGYRIIATSPRKIDKFIDNVELEKGPVAIFFGTELTGLTTDVVNNCDEFVKIPMYGFTKSLNISVTAALVIYILYSKLLKSDIAWHLSENEKQDIKLQWLRNSIKKSEMLEKEFLIKNK